MPKSPIIQPDRHNNNPRTIAWPHLTVTASMESNTLAIATSANWIDVQEWRTDLDAVQRAVSATPLADEQWFESYPAFEIDINCDAAEVITGTPKLYAVRLAPVTIADDVFTSSGTDAINTATSHAMLTGDGPFQLTTTDTLPAGLSLLTDYYVENTGANTFELYLTRTAAIAAGGGIATTDAGTGTHTIADVQGSAISDDDTRRCRHTLVGSLNSGDDITVDVQTSYMERINHSPLDLYYMVFGTATNTETLEIRLTPIMNLAE